MIIISRESKYAEGREFADLAAVVAEVDRWAPSHDQANAYDAEGNLHTEPEAVRYAVAALLDLPVKAVTIG